jgi:hypothetical protein
MSVASRELGFHPLLQAMEDLGTLAERWDFLHLTCHHVVAEITVYRSTVSGVKTRAEYALLPRKSQLRLLLGCVSERFAPISVDEHVASMHHFVS